MSEVLVIGAGMVGSAMALDLSEKHSVMVFDRSEKVLNDLKKRDPSIKAGVLDVNKEDDLISAVRGFDMVVSAVPGFLGYKTLSGLISAGVKVVDISFFPENALELDRFAKENEVTAIVDCGVAPGMDNIILGYHNEKMEVRKFECLVGGLPRNRKWPFEYKAPFSPVDVIEEYTRPARYMENGKVVIRPALTDVELIQIEGVGTLESFNSDGLRSILHTMSHIPDMKEKTLRYPGHADKIRILAETGFFDETSKKINGTEISPLEFTSSILFDEWKLEQGEEEMTVMRIVVEGIEEGENVRYQYDLHDVYDKKTQVSSMARTTGYTATAAVNLILDGHFTEKGVFPPELVGARGGCFEYIRSYLEERNVQYNQTKTTNP